MAREQLLEHLKFAAEMGLSGVSSDPAWRVRQDASPAAGSAARNTTADDADSVSRSTAAADDAAATTATKTAFNTDANAATNTPSNTPAGVSIAVVQDPADALADIKVDIGPACTRCKLHALGRSQVVFGVGNPKARLMFVGEAPGADEDEQGEPFVGRAGQLLTKIIEAIDLKREDVYIANVIKCRPPNNRNPEPDEVESCEPFLFRQIDAIRPRVIVALGKFGAQTLLRTLDPISRLRGRVFDYRGAKLIPTFHPAYLLRNPPAKREVWEDMKLVRRLLNDE